MLFNKLFHVGHSTITNLYRIFIKYFLERIDYLAENDKEFFTNFGFYLQFEWKVKPDDLSLFLCRIINYNRIDISIFYFLRGLLPVTLTHVFYIAENTFG